MQKYDDKSQIRKHKKNVKQLGNQKERTKAKRLLAKDPTSPDLLEEPNYGKLTSQGYNGLDQDKTRNTPYHQKNNNEPPTGLHTPDLDALVTTAVVLDTVSAECLALCAELAQTIAPTPETIAPTPETIATRRRDYSPSTPRL